MNNLELRMYGFVNYQLTGIQKGIQYGHAVVEYGQLVKSDKKLLETYNDWADNWKTFIILNGGTTNKKTSIEDGLPFGTLNRHLLTLKENNIDFAYFEEPDLGDQLTAITFIVDERVFNTKKYPDMCDWIFEQTDHFFDITTLGFNSKLSDISYENFINSDNHNNVVLAEKWLDFIGGDKNLFLRRFLKNFRLA
jgi:hypothetical protein